MQPNLIWRERSSSGGADERRRDVGHGHRPSRISAVPVTALRMVCSVSRGRQTTLQSSSTLPGYFRTNWVIITQIEFDWTPGLSVLESWKTDTRTITTNVWFQKTNNRSNEHNHTIQQERWRLEKQLENKHPSSMSRKTNFSWHTTGNNTHFPH